MNEIIIFLSTDITFATHTYTKIYTFKKCPYKLLLNEEGYFEHAVIKVTSEINSRNSKKRQYKPY